MLSLILGMQAFPINLFHAQPRLQPAFHLGTLPCEAPMCISDHVYLLPQKTFL